GDGDQRVSRWTQPAQQLHEPPLREADAARGRAGRDVEEDRRTPAGHDRARVVVDHREIPVLRRDLPERLARAAERRTRAAGDVPEAVVGRRARVFVPPVAADEPVIAKPHAGVRSDAVDRLAETVRAGRCRPVALALVRREPAPAEVCRPRPADATPAPAAPPPHADGCAASAGGLHRDELHRALRRGEPRAGEGSRGEEGGYAHPYMVAVPATPPPFVSRIERVAAADLPYSWHRGCPVGPSQLRRVRLRYMGFDGKPHAGQLVVNATVVRDVVVVFRTLYSARFPIRQMRPIDAFHGSDNRSAAADNTSAFNCRRAAPNGPTSR